METMAYQILRRASNLTVRASNSIGRLKRELWKMLALAVYHRTNCRPWSMGYYDHRKRYFQAAFNDPNILSILRDGSKLPAGYGFRLDARVVEIPWVTQKPARPCAEC